MNPLLVVILVYAISILLMRWTRMDSSECDSRLMEKACKSMPNCSWMFQSADAIYSYFYSPIFAVFLLIGLAWLLICLPLWLIRSLFFPTPGFSDPCFEAINSYVLERDDLRRFDEYEAQLLAHDFELIGTYKYKPDRLNQICRYFISRDRKRMVMVYCIYGDFQICIGSFFSDGSTILCTGVSEKLMSVVEHVEQKVNHCWWQRFSDLNVDRLLMRQENMCQGWREEHQSKTASISIENWKLAAVFFGRNGAHARVTAGQCDKTDALRPCKKEFQLIVTAPQQTKDRMVCPSLG